MIASKNCTLNAMAVVRKKIDGGITGQSTTSTPQKFDLTSWRHSTSPGSSSQCQLHVHGTPCRLLSELHRGTSMREYRRNRGTRRNEFKNAVSSCGTAGNGYVTVGNGREWFYLRSRGNGCKHFIGQCVCIISLSVRNRVCELTIIRGTPDLPYFRIRLNPDPTGSITVGSGRIRM